MLSRRRRMLRGSTALCAVVIALSVSGETKAQSITYYGGAANGNWLDNAQWQSLNAGTSTWSNAAPTAADLQTLIAAGGVSVTTGQTADTGRLYVAGGASVTISGGGVMSSTAALNTIGTNPSNISFPVPPSGFPAPPVAITAPTDGTGTLTVTGAGSVWNAGNKGVRIGDGAKGTLNVSDGGALQMTGGLLSVGLNANGDGTLNIDGGTATNMDALRLGYNGATGTVNITNGGALVTSNTSTTENHIGDASSGTAGTGIINISGAGSSWTIGSHGELTLGNGTGGDGKLTISDGGKLTFQNTSNILIGYNGGTGDVKVNGTDALFESAGGVNIGTNGGTGTFAVSDGGELKTTANGLGVGVDGGSGTLTVNAGKITSQGGLLIGFGSAPGMSVGSQGKMYVSNGSIVSAQDIFVAAEGATGELQIAGSQASIIGNVTIANGDAAQGTLSLADGTKLTAGHQIGAGYNGGNGTINVDGANTEMAAHDLVAGGGYKAVGAVNITNGAKVTIQEQTLIGDNGGTGPAANAADNAKAALNVNSGGSLNTGTMLLGLNGATGKLDVQSGGQVNVTGGMEIGWAGGTATANVTGQGTQLTTGGTIVVGHDVDGTAPATNGTLTVSDGAIVKAATHITVGFTNGTGTLNIGEGQKAGIIDTPYIAMSGASSTINFNHNEANYTFAAAINDLAGAAPAAGSVNFIGSGTTTLTAVSDYSVATNVNAGTLVIANGASIANSSLTTVNNGGTLSGAGTVGNVNVASGGVIAQSVGNTLTVKDITFASGSIYQVGINPAGQKGSIAANTATLNGGTVQVLAGSGNYAEGASYTILSTTGGVTGQFADKVGANFAFLTAALDYADPNKVDLKMTRNATSFASVAQTANQRATASGVSSLPTGNAVYGAVVQQDAEGARAAFDALSGEAHASAQGALINNSLAVSDMINNRLAWAYGGAPLPGAPATNAMNYADNAYASLNYADDGKKSSAKSPWMARKAPIMPTPTVTYAVWAEGLGSWLNRSDDGNAASMKSSTAGIISGLDVTFWDAYRVGIAGGYSRSDVSVGARASSLDADSYHISLYGGARQGSFGLQGGLIYSWNEIESNRSVIFPGFMQRVQANYNAGTTHVFGETNYQFLAGGTAVQAFAGFDYINNNTDAFAERGGAAALSVTGNDRDVVFTTAGLRSSAILAQSGTFTLVGRGTLAWRHAFGDTDTAISAAFAGGTPFSVTGTPIAIDAAYGEAGLDLNISPAATLGVAWSGQFGNNASENRMTGKFVYRW